VGTYNLMVSGLGCRVIVDIDSLRVKVVEPQLSSIVRSSQVLFVSPQMPSKVCSCQVLVVRPQFPFIV